MCIHHYVLHAALYTYDIVKKYQGYLALSDSFWLNAAGSKRDWSWAKD